MICAAHCGGTERYMKQITSTDNAEIKLLKKLEKKKGRAEAGLFLVEGLRACELAAGSPAGVDTFYLSDSFLERQTGAQPFWESFPCRRVSDRVFASVAGTDTPQGILCSARIPERTALGGRRYVYLDCVRDPGNVGTIIRTADALGFDGVLLSEGCADLYSPKVVRATMGSVFTISAAVDCTVSTLAELKERGFLICASALSETCVDVYRAQWGERLVFVLGNEANGVSGEVLALADCAVKIPMYGGAESFNVSIAAALLMGEAARREYEKR